MTSSPAEGSLHVRFAVEQGRFSRVSIANDRPLRASAVLAGRPAADLPRLVSQLFSVCRIAQGVASLGAVEQALCIAVDPVQQMARDALMTGEMLIDHATRACLDWTGMTGQPPAIAPLRRIRRALADLPSVLFPDGDWTRPGGGRLCPDMSVLGPRLAEAVEAFGDILPADPGAMTPPPGDPGLAGCLADYIRSRELEGFGAFAVKPMPDLPPGRLMDRFEQDDGLFPERPDWDGDHPLTGPLARRWEDGAVHAVCRDHGAGLMAHLVASTREMADGLALLGALPDLAGLPPVEGGRKDGGLGIGVVEAVRGRLIHRVGIRDGVVTHLDIVAPTEWNFHPQGPLVSGLTGAPSGADPLARIRLLVSALDPCVAVRISPL